jgi:hypothetical protein
MKSCLNIAIWLLAEFLIIPAQAQFQLLPEKHSQSVFAGDGCAIKMTWKNTGDETVTSEIRARIFQTTSTTAVELSETSWKKLEVLPQQTVIETAQLDFPAVKSGTKFLVQWLGNSNHVLGTTEVWVYPTNLLAELQPLAGEKAIGVFDPQNQLKPLLKNLQIEFEDLENIGVTNFSGKLAIIGSFQSKSKMPDDFSKQIELLAKKNTAIVWIQPNGLARANSRPAKLLPSFYSVPEKQITVVVTQPDLVSDFSENPQSQLNLIYFCKLALNPQPPVLPDLSAQP